MPLDQDCGSFCGGGSVRQHSALHVRGCPREEQRQGDDFLAAHIILQLSCVDVSIRGNDPRLARPNYDTCILYHLPGRCRAESHSCLIANLFSELHAFVDMNILYTDDELRKHAGILVGKMKHKTVAESKLAVLLDS